MAEEFHGGVCGGGNWWTSSLTTAFGSSPCSMGINGLGSFGWPIDHRLINMKTTRSGGDDNHQFSASDGSLTIQDLLSDNANSQENYPHTLQQGLHSNSSMDCSPQFGLDYPQIDDLSSRKFSGVVENSSINSIKQMSQVYQPANFSTGLPLNSASYGYTSALLQSLTNADSKPSQQFSYNAHSWTSANEASNVIGSSFLPSAVDRKPNLSNQLTLKANKREAARQLSSVTYKASNEPTLKRPRVETPSPLPTFKVRKEKLGDRVTALQQLVSPFGKTDTASVLQEAIEYIKFLHDQVSVLSTPYMKNVSQQQQRACKVKDQEGSKNDLRSRGLCLVPISSTFPIAAQNTSDIWAPSFGGRFS